MKPSAATVRKAKFCLAVSLGKSQRDAALEAGYAEGAGLDVTASRLMDDPEVIAELARLRAIAEDKAIATRDEALKLLTEQMRADWGAFLTFVQPLDKDGKPEGDPVPSLDLEKARKAGKLHLLQSYEVTAEGVRVKIPDKQGAIDRLGKMLGWNKPEEHKLSLSLNVAEMQNHELEAFLLATVREASVREATVTPPPTPSLKGRGNTTAAGGGVADSGTVPRLAEPADSPKAKPRRAGPRRKADEGGGSTPPRL